MFAVWALDRPGTGPARERVREAHRARLRAAGEHPVQVRLAGPLLQEGPGGAMCGTLLVVEAESADQVRAFVDGDPYVQAGVYGSVEVRPWRCGLGPLAAPG